MTRKKLSTVLLYRLIIIRNGRNIVYGYGSTLKLRLIKNREIYAFFSHCTNVFNTVKSLTLQDPKLSVRIENIYWDIEKEDSPNAEV